MHDEANVEIGVRRALPGVAEQPRLIVSRQRFDCRRESPPIEPQRRFDHGVEDATPGT